MESKIKMGDKRFKTEEFQIGKIRKSLFIFPLLGILFTAILSYFIAFTPLHLKLIEKSRKNFVQFSLRYGTLLNEKIELGKIISYQVFNNHQIREGLIALYSGRMDLKEIKYLARNRLKQVIESTGNEMNITLIDSSGRIIVSSGFEIQETDINRIINQKESYTKEVLNILYGETVISYLSNINDEKDNILGTEIVTIKLNTIKDFKEDNLVGTALYLYQFGNVYNALLRIPSGEKEIDYRNRFDEKNLIEYLQQENKDVGLLTVPVGLASNELLLFYIPLSESKIGFISIIDKSFLIERNLKYFLLIFVSFLISLSLMIFLIWKFLTPFASRIFDHTKIQSIRRKMAEKLLQQSEEKFEKIFNTTPDAIIITRASDGLILNVNEAFKTKTGYTKKDTIGKSSIDLLWPLHEDRLEFIKKVEMHGDLQSVEIKVRIKDGSFRWALLSTKKIIIDREECFIGIASDITKWKEALKEKGRLHEQLYQSQKLEAVGLLAGGIAHYFNNLLSSILTCSNLIRQEAEYESKIYNLTTTIETAAEKASDLTMRLLSFARKGKFKNVPVNVHEILNDILILISHTLEKNIKIIKRYHTNRSIVYGDPGQIEHALMNVVVNAKDAMKTRGKLRITTDFVEFDEKSVKTNLNATACEYIKISIIDTGCGIDRAYIDIIFEPFFTTKEKEKGKGLGLSVTYGIIENHGGFIEVESEPDRGSCFKVYIPCAEKEVTEAIKIEKKKEEIHNGIGNILLIDDEEIVRTSASDALSVLGYKVRTAANAREAIRIYKKEYNNFDLVIIDLIMPGLDGNECFRELKKINPDVKALISTGYGLYHKTTHVSEAGLLGTIKKPYTITEISQIIRDALMNK